MNGDQWQERGRRRKRREEVWVRSADREGKKKKKEKMCPIQLWGIKGGWFGLSGQNQRWPKPFSSTDCPPPPFFLPPSAPPSIFFALSSFSSVALSLSPSLSMSASKWQSLYQTWKVILVPPGFFKAASYNCTVSRERECQGYTEFKRSLVTLQRCRNLNSDLKRET